MTTHGKQQSFFSFRGHHSTWYSALAFQNTNAQEEDDEDDEEEEKEGKNKEGESRRKHKKETGNDRYKDTKLSATSIVCIADRLPLEALNLHMAPAGNCCGIVVAFRARWWLTLACGLHDTAL